MIVTWRHRVYMLMLVVSAALGVWVALSGLHWFWLLGIPVGAIVGGGAAAFVAGMFRFP
jgi:hypothetical protein